MGHVVLEAAQALVDVDLAARRRLHPQHVMAFDRGQLDQTVLALVDLAEPVGLVDGDQVTARRVGPGVERATEPHPVAPAIGNDLGAAVPAGIGEGAEAALAVPGHQDRQAGFAVRPVAAVFR